jgi:hypothetical protein
VALNCEPQSNILCQEAPGNLVVLNHGAGAGAGGGVPHPSHSQHWAISGNIASPSGHN